MNRTHPLEIPEILTRVGRHVPLWVHTKPSSSFTSPPVPEPHNQPINSITLPQPPMGPPYFDPQHLLSCIQVNRTWHDIFLPILCFSFDDTAVQTAPITTFFPSTTTTREGEERTVVKVLNRCSPPAVEFFLRNSLRFRLLVLTRPCAPILALPPAQLPIHLLHLELVGLDEDSSPFGFITHSPPQSSLSAPPPTSSSTSTFTPSTRNTSTTTTPTTTSCNEWSKALILQNTRLQSLRWQGGDFQRDNHGMLDSLALAAKLHRLQDLVLECWKLDQGFIELLRSNPGLRTLALDFVTGEALPPLTTTAGREDEGGSISGTATMGSSSLSSSSSYLLSLLNIPSGASSNGAYTQAKSSTMTNPTTGRYPPEWRDDDDDYHPYSTNLKRKNPNPYGFQLPHLTCLSVCKDVESGAFETLVRLCPNLEELSWMGPLDSDLEALTLNLAQCCPRVAVLTYSTVDVSEPEHRYAALVLSLPALVDLQIRIPTLEGGEFAGALLSQHAATLEILDLRIVNRRPSSATSEQSRESLRKILMGCSELTALSIEGAERMSEYLFLFTWACSPRLHRLFLAASISGDSGPGADVVVALQGQGQGQGQGPGQGQGQGQDVQRVQGRDRSSEEDSFVAEAALYGWSVVGSSRPSPRCRRHPSGTNTSDFDDDEDVNEDELDEEEGEVFVTTGGNHSTGSNPISGEGSSSSSNSNTILPSEIIHLHQGFNPDSATTTASPNTSNTQPPPYNSTGSIYGDEDTPMPVVLSTASSSSSSLSSSSSSAGSTSFVRDMMHRLEDMPRLQSFVLDGVEYTRMSSLMTAR
ncbi:hypothetical protein BGZ89_001436 [Linnemannia elongata]|nr:hypothetical protein BGZ89_001436 [Linnemannia elongata]